jgi:hypothetical protein
MSGQLYKRVRADIKTVDKVERESGIRAYCEQWKSIWALQVRGPMRLRNGREGKDFIVATAFLDREEMRALRDAIDLLLADDDLPATLDDAKEAAHG